MNSETDATPRVPRPIRPHRFGELISETESEPPVIHGLDPAAINREEVLKSWRRLWRVVLSGLTPLQRKALLEELESK